MVTNSEKDKYLKVFACCIPVKGKSRSILCDTQRKSYQLIPNALFDLIQQFDRLALSELIEYYGKDNKEIIEEYIEFLLRNEFAFLCDYEDLNHFPKINLERFYLPFKISTAIYEIDIIDVETIKHVIRELCSVDCYALEVRFQNAVSWQDLEVLLNICDDTTIKEINLVLINNNYTIENLKKLFFAFNRLTRIIVGCAANEEVVQGFLPNAEMIFTKRKVHLASCCGNFSMATFTNQIDFISEAISNNTCLNRKVSIDKDGYIKNCPSMSKSHGNIKYDDLGSVILLSDFQQLGNIKKDQIAICRECEFRYICMDCRAYLDSPNDPYSKPLKCGYDPSSCSWQEWSENPLKAAAISFYHLTEI